MYNNFSSNFFSKLSLLSTFDNINNTNNFIENFLINANFIFYAQKIININNNVNI